jgi:hypothetical protein
LPISDRARFELKTSKFITTTTTPICNYTLLPLRETILKMLRRRKKDKGREKGKEKEEEK